MNSILALLSNAASAIGSIFGWSKQRDAEKNTATMQAAAAAKQEQSEKDKTSNAVAKQNTSEIRDELSE